MSAEHSAHALQCSNIETRRRGAAQFICVDGSDLDYFPERWVTCPTRSASMCSVARYADVNIGHLLALCHYLNRNDPWTSTRLWNRMATSANGKSTTNATAPRRPQSLGHSRNARFSEPEVHLSPSLIFLVFQQTCTRYIKRIKQKLQTLVRPSFYKFFCTLNRFWENMPNLRFWTPCRTTIILDLYESILNYSLFTAEHQYKIRSEFK
jgi:hypothetical protein